MPLRNSHDLKTAVIGDWLNGKPRDTIARDNGVSTGSVSRIVSEWREELTYPVADALRELGIMLRKSRITASQCALGFRLASIMKEMGIDEDNFALFISEVYNKCTNIGIKPEYIAYNTKQILEIAGSIPLSQIPDYIQEKTKEKQELEENIKKLGEEELEAQATLMVTLDEKKQTLAELEEFSKLKVELDKLGIPTHNIRRTIGIIQGVRQSGYKVETITQLLSAWEASTAIQAQLEKKNNSLTVYNAELQEKNNSLWDQLWINRGKLSLCEDLQDMGFGLKELKLLSGLIKEVATANKIAPNIAVQKFFEDIEKDYDNKLGYESKLVHLKSDIVKTNYDLITVQKSLASKKQVAVALSELSLLGFNDQEIFNLALALQSNVSDKESLEADLNKYGSLKRLIQELTEELRILESTAMESIGFTCRLNMRIDFLETWQRKEYPILPPLVEAARGYQHEDNRLMTAIFDTTKLALINPDASYVFHGINRLHSSDNARVLSDEHQD